MTLEEITADIGTLREDLAAYEQKYGMRSDVFYERYLSGEEPNTDEWVLDWADWAGACQILLRRQEQYQQGVRL